MAKQYAVGARAWGICGRSGRKMLLKDMVFDGRYPNMRVDPDWYEARHPQETLPRVEDPVALYRPSPEVIAAPTAPELSIDIVGGSPQLTWTPADSDITEIASYDIYRGLNGATPTLLLSCAVERDFLGGIIGVDDCTLAILPEHPGDPWTNVVEDCPIIYLDAGESQPLLNENGQPLLNEDGQPLMSEGGPLPPGAYCYYIIANPMGNNISTAQGPPSAPSNTVCVTISSALDWTFRGDIAGANAIYGVATDGAGLTLLVDGAGHVYASTDGGHTWALRSSIPGGLLPSYGNLQYGDGVWIFGAYGTDVARSTDGGNTWSTIATGIASAGQGWVGTDGAGNWVLWGNTGPVTNNYAHSSDGGATWSMSGTFDNGGVDTPPFWDGAQWVALVLNAAQTDTVIATSADGATWVASLPSHGLDVIGFIGGLYVGADGSGARSSNTADGLASANPVGVPGMGNPEAIVGTAGLYFIFDNAGQVFNSPDFQNWFQGVANLAGGESVARAGNVAYDAANASYIAGGNAGSVITYP